MIFSTGRPFTNRICSALRGPADSHFANETGNSDPVGGLRLDFQQLLEQLRSPKVPDAVPERFRRRRLEHHALVANRNKADIRMTNRLQRKLVLDVAGFGVFAPEKFPPRRQIVEQGTHLDLSARRFAGGADGIDLASVDDNLCPFQSLVKPGRQPKTGYAGDARQRFTAKPKV